MPKYRDILKNKNFVLYNIGQMFSQFSDRLIHIALIGIVYKISPGSSMQLAKVLFFTVLPAFVISPIAGVYVDRLDKKKVLIAADVLRSLMVITIPLFFLSKSMVTPIYAVVFFIFVTACFFLPAKLSIIPDLVGFDSLLIANSLATVLWIAAGIIGFTAGGFLMEVFGLEKGLYLTSGIYLVSATVVSLITIKKKELPKNRVNAKHFLRELKDGVSYIISHKNVKFVVGIFFTMMSLLGALYVVGVVFIQELTKSMTASIGLIGLFLGAGFLSGAYFFGKADKKVKKTRTIFVSFAVSGALIVLFTVTLKMAGSIALASAIIFSLGFALSPIMIYANTLLHETIDEKIRGRVFSSLGIIMNTGFIIFMFSASYLAERIDKFWVITICGTVFSCLGIIGYFADRKT